MIMFDSLLIDAYTGDAAINWQMFALAGAPWIGGVLKVSQGQYYSSNSDHAHPGWLHTNWLTMRANGLRRGGYHYLEIATPANLQAEFYMRNVTAAGGFAAGDLPPIVDVETASNGNPSAKQIIDCTSTYAARIKQLTGRAPILYGGSFLHDHGITDRMGCDYLWIARYTATLPANVYERIGWTLDRVLAWQYRGDNNNTQLKTRDGMLYPDSAPGAGRVDISVITLPGGISNCSTLFT